MPDSQKIDKVFEKENLIKNDTIEIFKKILDTSLYSYLPDGSYKDLTRHSPFGDTVIVNADSKIFSDNTDLITLFPISFKKFKFKLLSKDQICNYATQYYTPENGFPNYLDFIFFEKKDSIYSMMIRSNCISPNYDKVTKTKILKQQSDSFPCFSIMCGGGMAMKFIKSTDTLISKREGQWSD